MQKKIIALAIAGLSSAAFAQSNVTISGNLDMGYQSQSLQTTTAMDVRGVAANGSSTSTITIAGSENLGGGMTASFQFGNDLAAGASSSSSVINAGQSFLKLAGGFGAVTLGNINTASLVAVGASNPFGTAFGGGYSGNFSRLSRAGVNGTWHTTGPEGEFGTQATAATVAASGAANSGSRMVRANSSFMYNTPSMSGFSASLQWAGKNSDAAVAAAANTPGLVELGLAYNNGPLNVHYVNSQVTVGTGAGAVAPLTAVAEKVTHNVLSANYTFGPATVYGGWTSSKSSIAATADSRSWNLALKYAVSGALSLQANILRVDDKLVGNQDRNLNGLGLDYAMSKRTTAYARYESGDNDKSAVVGNGTGGFSRWAVGARHSF